MIKLPSVQTVAGQLITTLKRFPLTILCGIMGAVMLSLITRNNWWYYNHDTNVLLYTKIAMCAELGLCLFLAAALFCESKGYDIGIKIAINAFAAVLLVVYFFTIRRYEHFRTESLTRYSLYVIATHLLVAFAAFTGKGQVNGFWQFNRALFLRFLLSFLYTVVLYGGISLAMWLLDDLLHVTIHSHYYAYMWYLMMGLFNTVFFLAGVPKNINELDSDPTYLKGLKGFTQFVLLPLVTGYMLILYAYSLRIMIIGNLPKGYVSYLVLTFSGIGILSLLLIYPIRNHDDNKWIKTFSRWFYWALFPLVVLLSVSIYHRVHEYGTTADRYFIIVLAIWLVCMAAYFLFSNKENIKVIPVSLFTIAILSSFGPWSAFSISANSQVNQLNNILVKNKIMVNNKIDTNAARMTTDSVRYRAEEIIRYLVETGQADKLQPYLKLSIDSLDGQYNYSRYYDAYSESQVIAGCMGFNSYWSTAYSNSYLSNAQTITFNRATTTGNGSDNPSVDVRGFDYYSQFDTYYRYNVKNLMDTVQGISNYRAGKDTVSIIPFNKPSEFEIRVNGKKEAEFNMHDFLKGIQDKQNSPNDSYITLDVPDFKLDIEGVGYSFRFCLRYISASLLNGNYYITQFSTDVLTKKK